MFGEKSSIEAREIGDESALRGRLGLLENKEKDGCHKEENPDHFRRTKLQIKLSWGVR